ncbi:hypothetical protein [Nonomuraea endophytica]|uniref:hypothetical protein n=1 Tax=Nonomuraea endophytica TaxID=714136 RepID=UPI0037C8B9DD
MPRLIETTHDTITVDHSQFLLAGWLGGRYENPAGWPSWDETAARAGRTDWFVVTANRGVVTSALGWHEAHATLELWDEEPPDDGDRWDQSRTAGFYCSSGFAYLDGIYGRGPDFPMLDLRGERREWMVRACCRRGADPGYPEDAPPLGLEEWRFQFWPAPERP